jgi:hypothetical protein
MDISEAERVMLQALAERVIQDRFARLYFDQGRESRRGKKYSPVTLLGEPTEAENKWEAIKKEYAK